MSTTRRQAAEAILGTGLALPSALEIAVTDHGLRAEHFHLAEHRAIFSTIIGLRDASQPVTELVVTNAIETQAAAGKAPWKDHGVQGAIDLLNGLYAADYFGISQIEANVRLLRDAAKWERRDRGLPELERAIAEHDDDAFASALANLDGADGTRDDSDIVTAEQLGSEFIDWYSAKHTGAIPTPFAELNDLLGGGFLPGCTTVVAAWSSMGKALDVETPIATPSGWTTMGRLLPGDTVYGSAGQTTKVIAATDVMRGRPCYRVAFSDGSTIIADAEHLWTVDTRGARRSKDAALARAGHARRGPDQSHKRTRPVTITTRELARLAGDQHPPSIDLAPALQAPHAELPIDPYVLGVWLGDGTSRMAAVTAHIDDVGHYAAQFAAAGEAVSIRPARPDAPHIITMSFGALKTCRRAHPPEPDGARCRKCRVIAEKASKLGIPSTDLEPWTESLAIERLRSLGVVQNKHIPLVYMRSSAAQRLALLQGIVDTDGHVQKAGTIEVTLTNQQLAEDVLELALTLGVKATMTESAARLDGRDVGRRWRITWLSSLPCARLPRKAQRLRKETPRQCVRRLIKSVEPIQSRPVKCIQVDAEDHLYLAGRSLIATHNSVLVDQFATHATSLDVGRTACVYTNEMVRQTRTARTISRMTGVPFSRIVRKQLRADDYAKVVKAAGNLPFPVKECAGWSADEIARHVRRHRWDVWVVDLATRIPARDTADWDHISGRLTDAALQTGTHGILVCQLNQQRNQTLIKPPPIQRDLRNTGSWYNDATNVVFVHREQRELETTDGRPMEIAETLPEGIVRVEKSRNDEPGVMPVTFNPQRMSFEAATHSLAAVA